MSIKGQPQGGIEDFFDFEEKLLRLKRQLKVRTDKEAAALLGMEASALNKRKMRGGTFPEAELEALASIRPDLDLDPYWVLTGVDAQTRRARASRIAGDEMARRELRSALVHGRAAGMREGETTYDEMTMLSLWRGRSKPEQAALLLLMLNFEEAKTEREN